MVGTKGSEGVDTMNDYEPTGLCKSRDLDWRNVLCLRS